MTVGTLYFSVCAIVCVVGALATVIAKNPIRGAVGLLATIVGIAGLFLKLQAQFLAAIQLIMYAGAVVVLFVFVIMLLGPDSQPKPGKGRVVRLVGGSGLLLLAVVALLLMGKGELPATPLTAVSPGYGSTEAVGGLLFSAGIVPFELVTALLIVAVVGAISVARSRHVKKQPSTEDNETRRLFAGPLHPRDAQHPLRKEEAE